MENQIVQRIELEAPLSRVRRALTDHREYGEWFRVALDGPFVVGKETRGHITYPGYEHLIMTVAVQRMENESLFSFTWHPCAIDPQVDYSGEPPTLVEFKLEAIAQGTMLMVTETGFAALPANRRDEALRMNDNGWTIQLGNIAKHVG